MKKRDFDRAILELTGALKPFALNLTRDSEDANDLLQETMVRAISNYQKFNEGTNLKAWLFTIMKNIFINNYRRNSKSKTIIDTTDNNYFIDSTENITVNQATANFVMDDITMAIKSLSDDYRVPFMMHYEGFKYHEIADQLRLPLGTVKSRIFFARKELKAKLKTYEQ